jgi:hypothetical protein
MNIVEIYKHKYIGDSGYFKILIKVNNFYTIRFSMKDILYDIHTDEFKLNEPTSYMYMYYKLNITNKELEALYSKDLTVVDMISKILINRIL